MSVYNVVVVLSKEGEGPRRGAQWGQEGALRRGRASGALVLNAAHAEQAASAVGGRKAAAAASAQISPPPVPGQPASFPTPSPCSLTRKLKMPKRFQSKSPFSNWVWAMASPRPLSSAAVSDLVATGLRSSSAR
jgi:hypothetical protein